ncbi:MAG: hypothetical protein L0Z55_07635 [Planctomycetes bacterium]|nr:hypothetical protein [Planctomycetota bacterium]
MVSFVASVPLVDLWIPIIAAAVAVFVVSSIIHMVLPIHRGDFKKLPGEAAVLEAMRTQGVQPGSYMFPCAGSMKEMCTPEMTAKMNQGPVGNMTVLPSGPFSMGKSLLQWFVYSVVIGVFVAYIAGLGLARGADFMAVFRFTGAAAVLGYALSNVCDSIWKGVSWGITAKFIFDGVLYGLATGAVFGWLWPAAAA